MLDGTYKVTNANEALTWQKKAYKWLQCYAKVYLSFKKQTLKPLENMCDKV